MKSSEGKDPGAGGKKRKILTRRRAIGLMGAGAAGVALAGAGGLWLRGVGRRMGRLSIDLGAGARAAGEGATGAPPIRDFRRSMPEGAAGLADLAIARGGSDPASLVRAAIRELGGMERFVGRGERVLIKPNAAWDRVAEQAANTNPEVVRALIELCLGAGASRVVVSDGGVNDPRRAFDRSGIAAAARAAGATIAFARDKDLKDLPVGGEMIRTWPFYMSFFEADRLINVPIVKHHGGAGLTIGMKNWFGVIGGARNHLHQRMHQSIADLAAFVRPTLTVVDGFRVLVRNGPNGGSTDDVKLKRTVVASIDPVAADAAGAVLMDWRPEDLEWIRLAEARGLGRIAPPKEATREVVL